MNFLRLSLLWVVSSMGMAGLAAAAPMLAASDAEVEYLEAAPTLGALFTLSDAMVDSADEVTPVGTTTLNFLIAFTPTDPLDGSASGDFLVEDDDGTFLAGTLAALAYGTDRIQMRFGALTGAAAGQFGTMVQLTMTFLAPIGDDPFAALVDGAVYDTSLVIEPAAVATPVPLPAAMPMLVLALGGFAALARGRIG
jgi:hypothetical protein